MATIIPYKEGHRALVRRRDVNGKLFVRTKTFTSSNSYKEAEKWGNTLDRHIQSGKVVVVEDEQEGSPALLLSKTFGELVQMYSDTFDTDKKPFGETKKYIVKWLLTCSLADRLAESIMSADFFSLIKKRGEERRSAASTLYQYANIIHQIYSVAYAAWSIDVPTKEIDAAMELMKKTEIVKTLGEERDRRLKGDEYERILAWLTNYDKTRSKSKASYAAVFEFAVHSAFRLGEICRIVWKDIDEKKRTIIIRDRKHPSEKKGNDQEVPLLPEMWRIIQAQPRKHAKIFPLMEGTISALFAKCCGELHIEDLHFHDTRHEGTSRLFEMGYQIQEVAIVTGHKDWKSLKRYTQIKPESLHRERF